ncbi:winged helix-turn-helix domain-containing protein [Campylobacter concisus]
MFDKNSLCVRKEGGVIYLGKKESQLLEILCKNSPHVVTYDEIDHHLYKNESLSQECIRSLVREIRAKIPTICLKTIRSTRYKVE